MAGSLRISWTSGSCIALFLLSSGSSFSTHRRRPDLASWGGRTEGEGGGGGVERQQSHKRDTDRYKHKVPTAIHQQGCIACAWLI